MLSAESLVAFAATTDGQRAAAFYGTVLGLPIRSDDAFAIVFDANGVERNLLSVTQYPID